MNTEQASKVIMQEPTRSLFGEGRRHPGKLPGSQNDPARMNLPGYLVAACQHRKLDATREAPAVGACDSQPEHPQGKVSVRTGVAERLVVPLKFRSSRDGGKGP